MRVDLIIRGGICVSHRGQDRADIAVRDGIIVAFGDLGNLSAEKVIDGTGKYILPGVIDTEIYENELLGNDSRAAVRGGVTSALFINSHLSNEKEFYCDYGYFEPATSTNEDQLSRLEQEEGCAGIFLSMSNTGNFEAFYDDRNLLNVLKNGSRRVVIHAEDQMKLDQRRNKIIEGDVKSHLAWHDEAVAIEATRRILAIARGAGRPVHLMHISTDKEMAMVAAYKDISTAAVSPAHLLLSAPDCYDHYLNYAKIDPPLRGEENRIGLWKALSGGIVDILASSHCPQAIEYKELTYPNCVSGIPSVQTMMPQMLDQVNKGSLSLQTLVDITGAGPARVFNIASKGRIAVGYDADFTIVELNSRWIYEDEDVDTACGWDLFAGSELTGQVTSTIIRGQEVMRDGRILSEPIGKTLKFYDNYKPYEDV
ncbi:MAG: amidohydrolase family protein [Kordiimonadaceae bacterium]|nr:amidohydrolase family protein [Kordiimonadaceae bacterium]